MAQEMPDGRRPTVGIHGAAKGSVGAERDRIESVEKGVEVRRGKVTVGLPPPGRARFDRPNPAARTRRAIVLTILSCAFVFHPNTWRMMS